MESRRVWGERLHKQLDPAAWTKGGLSPANWLIALLILTGTIVSIAATEKSLEHDWHDAIRAFDDLLFTLFAIEFVARFWAAGYGPGTDSAMARRLRFLRTPWAIVDFFVLVAAASTLVGGDVVVFRLLRLARIMALASFGRMSVALQHLVSALATRKYELLIACALAAMLLLFGATALYWAEGDIQPQKFGSIPRALWWAIITLTTIGYGDVSPVTPLGKLLAGLVAIAGVAMVAMPTGIMAAAFSDAMQRHRDAQDDSED